MSETAPQPLANIAPVLAEPANVCVAIQKQVTQYVEKGTLHLPADYSPENALKSAWLTLQECKDRTGRPVLEVCTRASIMNALLDMVVQGLNPAKKQCYFIAYGQALMCQRSYFGDVALAQRMLPGTEIFYGVVYEGDGFEYQIIRGRKCVTHTQKLENIDPQKIKAAYCGVLDEHGNELGTEVMTMEQIRKSWGQSKTYKPGEGVHGNFPDQMALRTVIRRRCKPIINASNDALLLESIRRQGEDAIDAEVDQDIAANGNGEVIDVTPILRADAETGEVIEGQLVTDQQPEQPALETVEGDPGY